MLASVLTKMACETSGICRPAMSANQRTNISAAGTAISRMAELVMTRRFHAPRVPASASSAPVG